MVKRIEAVMDKVVVKLMQDDRKTDGGIFIPDSVVNLPQLTGQVISVGDKVKCVKANDYIYCHRNAGMDILVDGIPMKVLTDGEIYAKLTGDSNDSPSNETIPAPGIKEIVDNE